MIVWQLGTVALAAPLAWTSVEGKVSSTDYSLAASCPAGTTVVGGGGKLDSQWLAGDALLGTAPSGSTTWAIHGEATATKPDDTANFEVAALCADPPTAACIEQPEVTSAIDTASTKTVTALCPAGTLAYSGGAEIVGTQYGRGFSTFAPVGLLLPIGWTATVEAYDDDTSFATAWGVRVVAYCVEVDAYEDLTVFGPVTKGDDICFDSSCMVPGHDYAADATYRFGDPGMPIYDHCPAPLAGGMIGDPGRWLVSSGPDVDVNGQAERLEVAAGTFDKGALASTLAICADDLWQFGLDIADTCAEIEPPHDDDKDPYELDLSRWAIGATIVYGVIQDGGGLVWLPGKGPLPIDPLDVGDVLAGLPVAVVAYENPEQLDEMVSTVAAGLDEERVAYVESDALESALREDALALIEPGDEASAVAWLSEHREAFEGRSSPVLLFLQRDGAGMETLQKAW